MSSSIHPSAACVLTLIGLLAGASPALAQASKPESAGEKLPEARMLMTKAVKAMGGRENFKKIKYLSAIGALSVPAMGMEATMEMHSGPDGKFLMKQIMEGMGEQGGGSNGEIGWSSNPMSGVTLVEGDDLADQRRVSALHLLLVTMDKNFSKIETTEKTTLGDQDAYLVHASNGDDGGTELSAFLPIDGGLPLGMEILSDQGPILFEFVEWKEFQGVQLFTELTIDQSGMEIMMTFEELKINDTDDSIFDPPQEVKDLLEKQEAEKAAASQPDDN